MEKTVLILCIFFFFGCAKENAIAPTFQTISFQQKVEMQLISEGYAVERSAQGLVISGFKSMDDGVAAINRVLDHMGQSSGALVPFTNDHARIYSCTSSAIYDSGSSFCQNFLCIGDSSNSVLPGSICMSGTCYIFGTTCIQRT